MDSFVRQLVARLLDPEHPMSRNRHFHTFTTPEGTLALKLARRLRTLERDLTTAIDRKYRLTLERTPEGTRVLTISSDSLRARRQLTLSREEFELLELLPAAREALARAHPAE